jgi:two-component system phosphate regulon response regulator PhoB
MLGLVKGRALPRGAGQARRKALVVHDDLDVRTRVRAQLESEDFVVLESQDSELGLALAIRERPAVVILDVHLRGVSGIDLCRRLRADERTARTPIVVLTARDAELDRVLAFEMGADTYLTTPFHPREFVIRVKSLVSRVYDEGGGEPPHETYERGGLRVDFESYEVHFGATPIKLRLIEFELLKFFILHSNRAHDRATIIETIWGPDTHVDPRTVDQHVMRLRRRLEEHLRVRLIVSVRGIGYMFDERLLGG